MNKVIIHRRRGLSELHGLKAALLHPITEKESNKQTIQAAPQTQPAATAYEAYCND